MLHTLVNVGRIQDLAQLLSPAFLKVFPPSRVVSALRELVGNYRNRERFEEVVDQTRRSLSATDIALDVVPPDAPPPEEPTRPEDGATILELYFHQLCHGDTALLDLGRARFGRRGDQLVWAPSKLWIEWDATFLSSIRDLYGGFYSDDDEQFRAGLDRLSLGPAESLFRAHFGGDEQRRVDFHLETFRDTFLEILQTCKQAGVSLHEHFVPLGFYLVSLYDHLDQLDARYDVRSAFQRAHSQVEEVGAPT